MNDLNLCYDGVITVEQRLSLEIIMRHLTPIQKQLIVMYYVDGYTMSELADIMGRCNATVNRRLKIAMHKMRRTAYQSGGAWLRDHGRLQTQNYI